MVCATGLILTMGMSATVFAAGSSNPDNPNLAGQITVEKNLKVVNANLNKVDGPGAVFSYAIAPEAPSATNGGLTITDDENPAHTGTVHQGPAGGVSLSASTIEFPIGEAVDAAAAPGADNVKSINVVGDISAFTAPGIYRYKLTETSTSTCQLEETGDDDRYIDVYVKNNAAGTGLEFSGFVMHDGSVEAGAPAQKQTFDNALFETVNITLKKTVSGNMADRNNQFPFAGTVTDSNRFFFAKKAEAPTAVDANKNTNGAIDTTLCHDEMFYISGLSHDAAVTYTETNNTQDVYQTEITGGTASASSAVNPSATKAMDSTDVDNAAAVEFINTLEEVSPTGVILRFGAPLAVLIAAIALFALNRKSRKQA